MVALEPVFHSLDPVEVEVETRGYTTMAPADTNSVHAFAIKKAGTAPGGDVNVEFVGNNTKWTNKLRVVAGNSYNIYAYYGEGSATVDAGTEKMTISDMPVVSRKEPSASIASWITPEGAMTDGTHSRTEGTFFSGQIKSPTATVPQYYVNFAMEHLFARVKFHFTLDPAYGILRNVKLQKVTLKCETIKSVSPVITFGSTLSIDWSNQTAGKSEAVLYSNAGGTSIKSGSVDAYGTFLVVPTAASSYVLECEYELEALGGLIIGSRTTQNKITFTAGSSPQRGEMVTLNCTIRPSYLYQLADTDLDNPVLTIN